MQTSPSPDYTEILKTALEGLSLASVFCAGLANKLEAGTPVQEAVEILRAAADEFFVGTSSLACAADELHQGAANETDAAE